MNRDIWPNLIATVKQNVTPALGCTEPMSIALAAAIARHHLGKVPEHIDVSVSPNLYKNCMGVTVPGTDMAGIPIAAAVGALGGDPDGGLEVLKPITPGIVVEAKEMLREKRVCVRIADVESLIYTELHMRNNTDEVTVIIADRHTHVIRIQRNDTVLFSAGQPAEDEKNSLFTGNLLFRDLYDFATQAPFEDIKFILKAKDLNDALSQEGLRGSYGLQIGKTLEQQRKKGLLDSGLLSEVLIRASSASDARMGGAVFPAMSNSGSGNQGIAATMPVVVVAEYFAQGEEKLARALILSHLTAIHIHEKYPPLSALCAVTTAGMGAAAAISWLIKDDYQAASQSVLNMIGDISGIFCDGASNSCSLKISTSAGAAFKAVLLAANGCTVSANDGIIGNSIDQTIENLCHIVTNGMKQTDKEIINIMYKKGK